MRQIHVCAWLLLASLLAAACSGEKFTSGALGGASNETPPTSSAGSNSHNTGASGGSKGTVDLGEAGKSTRGGAKGLGGTGGGSGGALSTTGGMSSGTTSSGAGGYDDGAGGEPADTCPSGTITFRMVPGNDLGADYLCDAGCGTGWLTITDAEGASAFSIFSACGTASCESCEMLACAAAACLPTPLTAEGSELVWTGTYLAKDTCGANMACQRQACVKPGKYKAKACAAINSGASPSGGACTPQSDQLCAEADFEFPATKTVKLVLTKP